MRPSTRPNSEKTAAQAGVGEGYPGSERRHAQDCQLRFTIFRDLGQGVSVNVSGPFRIDHIEPANPVGSLARLSAGTKRLLSRVSPCLPRGSGEVLSRSGQPVADDIASAADNVYIAHTHTSP